MLLGNGQIRMFGGILSRARQPENAAKFVLLGVFTPIETICQRFLRNHCLKACLRGGGRAQTGEVTCGGSPPPPHLLS